MHDKDGSRTDLYQLIALVVILLAVLVGLWMLVGVRNGVQSLSQPPPPAKPTPAGFNEPSRAASKDGFVVPPPPGPF